jgi:hypothetical protein
MGHKNATARLDPELDDSPQHESAIDSTSAIQERLDYASNAIEFARRQRRDGHPKAAAFLEQVAHANLCEAKAMLIEFLGGWEFLLGDGKLEPLAYDRVIDEIAKGKWPQDLPLAYK